MFAAPLYFHPHYLHAEFYARSERKTEQVLRANKIQTKLKGEAVTIPVNLAKAKCSAPQHAVQFILFSVVQRREKAL